MRTSGTQFVYLRALRISFWKIISLFHISRRAQRIGTLIPTGMAEARKHEVRQQIVRIPDEIIIRNHLEIPFSEEAIMPVGEWICRFARYRFFKDSGPGMCLRRKRSGATENWDWSSLLEDRPNDLSRDGPSVTDPASVIVKSPAQHDLSQKCADLRIGSGVYGDMEVAGADPTER